MDKLLIEGPVKLSGTVEVSAAKNATLPILAATLLFEDKIHFHSLPELNDVATLIKLLQSLGVKVQRNSNNVIVDAIHLDHQVADYQLVKTMRASVLVLGPLLARYHQAKVSLPGGCAIGARPVDIHLKGLEEMNAKIEIENGYILAKTDQLKGAKIVLSFPSVGATENLMMAAVLAKGETIIENAAQEPEIVDLANFLIFHGIKISGAGS
jgi:UDP-N-acetylglucosamine 1-carboxyvinyltransferase